MRLLFVHERFGALAGAESNAFLTATALKARGHEVGILHGPSTAKDEASWNETFTSRFALNPAAMGASVKSALGAFHPDVVYVHKMADLKVISTLVESRLPLVRMVHDHDIYCMRSYKYHYFSRKICKRAASLFCVVPCGASIARNPGGLLPIKFVSYLQKKKEIRLNQQFDRMVVVTNYMKEELLRNGFDRDRIEIHPPVPRMGDPGLSSSFSDRNLIIYAGQIIRGKGVDILLRILATVESPFECLILGDGSHRAYCESLAHELGLTERVKFLGFVPQNELKSFYSECSVVTISSVWPEPFATIGMEVMRYGIPVVAFDAGGIKDWLQDGYNGFLVPWMDCREYARRLDQLLGDKNLAREMGERGRTLVNERYSFPDYISDLESMFRRVTEERQGTFRAKSAVPDAVSAGIK